MDEVLAANFCEEYVLSFLDLMECCITRAFVVDLVDSPDVAVNADLSVEDACEVCVCFIPN